ncbi:hypothetical protein A3860_09180 [Niastella vici]|uniref:Uncharacterized protein n=1 Tax=Niastella vici TaxID=1703345 RepID=A0A1V9FHD6_9BACT|nr:hypothetical protein [Niastella vici]OQP57788.1 hypothetical protein A3860_09180 [Niastella vici]
MSELLIYKTLLLQRLISILQEEGIEITTTTAIDIEKVLARVNLQEGQSLAGLKYLLSPLICRNKEDQELVHKVFDKLEGVLEKEYKPAALPPAPVIKAGGQKTPNKFQYLWLGLLAIIACGLITMAWFFVRNFHAEGKKIRITSIKGNMHSFIVNDTVGFTAVVLDKSIDTANVHVEWKMADTVIGNQLTVVKVLTRPCSFLLTVYLKNSRGRIIDSDTYQDTVYCEATPSVAIDEKDVSSGSYKVPGKKKQFTAQFTNPSPKKDKYTYRWYVDDSLASTNAVFTYAKPYNSIALVVGWPRGLHCSMDSMTAKIFATPAVKATLQTKGRPQINNNTNWGNILFSVLWLLLTPAVIGMLAFRLLSARKRRLPKAEVLEPGTEGPFAIEFPDQHNNINTEHGISKLADVLRKRQVSEVSILNMRKTIRATITAGGLPVLQFRPLTKPLNYLVFIDKEKPDSHLTRLFGYLMEKLKREEVNVYVYEYFKEPLFLSNEKLNHNRIPLEKMAALYPDTTLFIFGDARYFLYPVKGTLKSWVSRKLESWPVRFLITPYAKADWDKKEKLLIDSGFVVLPADLSGIPVLDKVISRHIDIPAQKKEPLDDAYRSRTLNFNEFEVLQQYLNDAWLLQWVCSLAVYNAIDWNFTLAMGKAIEQKANDKGQPVSLVNYTNLLKLGRISWMQDGILPQSLRVQMLTYLSRDAEALARQVLAGQLELIEETIPDDSIVKTRFDRHRKLNNWLLAIHNNDSTSRSADAYIWNLLNSDQLDEGQAIFLEKGRNTLLRNPLKKDSPVGIRDYFKLKFRHNFFVTAGYSLLIVVGVAVAAFFLIKEKTDYLTWTKTLPVVQRFVITGATASVRNLSINLGRNISVTQVFPVPLPFPSDTPHFSFDILPLTDTNVMGAYTITTDGGQLLLQDSFRVNADTYYIDLKEIPKTPLAILYGNVAAVPLAKSIAENLPAAFNVELDNVNLKDTTAARVYYLSANHLPDAQLAAATVNDLLKLNIKPELVGDFTTPLVNKPDLAIWLNPRQNCTSIAASALPASLNEIWKGSTSTINRFLQIDLANKVMYYSTGDINTYGTYGFDEVCFNGNGVYRIITHTRQGYKLFFIRNVKPQSFELSVCQDFAATKEELRKRDESYCDRFNTMGLFYPNDPELIYLPVSGYTLVPSEKRKLDRKVDSIYGNIMNQKVSMYGVASNATDQKRLPDMKRILANSKYPDEIDDLYISFNTAADRSFLPFQRIWLKLNLRFEKLAKDDQKANSPVQNNYPAQTSQVPPAANNPVIAPQNIDLGYFYMFGNRTTEKDNVISFIIKELKSNAKARLTVKEYYTESTDEKQADSFVIFFVKFLGAYVKDASKQIDVEKIKLPRNQLPQEGGKIPATKNASEVIHITGVNFSADYNTRGVKKS